MTYAEYFSSVKTRFMGADVSDIREHLAYQFNVIGEESGIFYVEVKNGELFVEPYEYYDRDVMFTATAKTFTDLMEGKLDPVLAFTLQKLKVEGNFDKALMLNDLIKRAAK
ncbi:MAG: SCP2 sterol-binding domain-containing protein [Blautia sp.]|nr:SCP2 sterol-binding domain-containing protein [Blautia sp.]MDY5031479.1 SCP2 sterol-binding domain-containing protein [Blautia sp.]